MNYGWKSTNYFHWEKKSKIIDSYFLDFEEDFYSESGTEYVLPHSKNSTGLDYDDPTRSTSVNGKGKGKEIEKS